MKVALIQMNSGSNKNKNLKEAFKLANDAIKQKAEFVLFPEVFNYRGAPSDKKGFFDIAEEIPGNSSMPFMDLARKHNVCVLLGSIYEKGSGLKKVYNTSVFINSSGKIEKSYRKINLFEANVADSCICEANNFLPGKMKAIVGVDKFKLGLSICYDLRFPEMYRFYAGKGADALCVASSFTNETGKAHWEVLLRARAIENLSYVLAPNQVGTDGKGVVSYGNSMVISPWGEVIARGSKSKQEIVYAKLDHKKIVQARKRLPDKKIAAAIK